MNILDDTVVKSNAIIDIVEIDNISVNEIEFSGDPGSYINVKNIEWDANISDPTRGVYIDSQKKLSQCSKMCVSAFPNTSWTTSVIGTYPSGTANPTTIVFHDGDSTYWNIGSGWNGSQSINNFKTDSFIFVEKGSDDKYRTRVTPWLSAENVTGYAYSYDNPVPNYFTMCLYFNAANPANELRFFHWTEAEIGAHCGQGTVVDIVNLTGTALKVGTESVRTTETRNSRTNVPTGQIIGWMSVPNRKSCTLIRLGNHWIINNGLY